MNAVEAIALLQAAVAEHGRDIEVVARECGDFLESNPTLHVEERCRYSWAVGWQLPEPAWLEGEPPLATATVVYFE